MANCPTQARCTMLIVSASRRHHIEEASMSVGIIHLQFLCFIGTGALNTAFGYGVFCLGLAIGLGLGQALALQFSLGVPFNYALHGRFVFGLSGWARLPAYAAVYLGLYAINLVALKGLALLLPAPLAQAALILPMAALSFLILSKLLR